jgi:hypothetical protein
MHGPAVNDVSTYYSVDTAGIIPGSAGNNQTWDFSSLTLAAPSATSMTSFIAPSPTPYATQYSTSNIVTAPGGGLYSYYLSDNSGFYHSGFSVPSYSLIYTNPQQLIKFPFSYGNTSSDNYSGSYTVASLTSYRYGSTTLNADGEGTLILPTGSYSTLRMKRIQTIVDSVPVGPIASVLTSTITEYIWYSANQKYPLFLINLFNVSNPLPLQSSKVVLISSVVSSTNDLELFGQLDIFPNPSSGPLTIAGELPQASELILQVMDMNGRVCYSQDLGNQSAGAFRYDFPEGILAQGVYQFSLSSREGRSVRRIIVQ